MKKFLNDIQYLKDLFSHARYINRCSISKIVIDQHKELLERVLERHFENTPYHSFELKHHIFPKITHVNNVELPLDFLRTNIYPPSIEGIKTQIQISGYEPDVFLMNYNIKEEELISLFNKFNNSLLCCLGNFANAEPCILKYENKKLTYTKIE